MRFSLLVISFIINSQGAIAQKSDIMPGQDSEFVCIDQKTAKDFTTTFNIEAETFGGIELCNNQHEFKKLMNDLVLIRDGAFTTQKGRPSNTPLIHGFVEGKDYFSWFKSQTYGINRGNDVPYATAYNSGGYFTMQNGWALLSTLGRVGTVIHEARHTEGYRHIPCTTGPYAGSQLDGCDGKYSEGGSHAVEMEYYARVAVEGENFHPLYQTMARLMAVARSNFVFNQSPIQTRKALVLLDQQHQAWLWDRNQLMQRSAPVLPSATLKRSSFGAVLLSLQEAYAIESYDNHGHQDPISDDYSYYKLLKDSRAPQQITDVEELDIGNRRYFLTLMPNNQISSFQFRQGQFGRSYPVPSGSQKFLTLNPVTGATGLHVLTRHGQVHSINAAQPQQQQLLNFQWPAEIETLVQFNNRILGLDKRGQIMDGNVPYSPLQSLRVSQFVDIPMYDAFEVTVK